MHEMGITQSIVAIVAEQADGRKVKRVTLEIGKLAAVMPDAIRFCFDVVAQGSALDGAALDIHRNTRPRSLLDCGSDVMLTEVLGQCGCGSRKLERLAGQELNIKSMELEVV